MHPTAYMPFYGNDFFGALEGYDAPVLDAYLRALWHYWHHCHCEGLPGDAAYLRRICRVDPSAWPTLSPLIFGKLFTLGLDGLWHQKRAKAEYARVHSTYQQRVAASAAGCRARSARSAARREACRVQNQTRTVAAPDNRTVPPPVNRPVAPPVNRKHTNQNQNQNQTHNQNNNQIQIQTQNPDPEQLNDELPPTPPNGPPKPDRSSAIRLEKDLMGQLQELLGADEMARAGGHWRKNWVRTQPDLVARALADLRLQIRERGPDFADCRAAWLTDLLKRWLPKSRPITGPAPRQPLEPAGPGPDITAPGSTLQENESTPESTHT